MRALIWMTTFTMVHSVGAQPTERPETCQIHGSCPVGEICNKGQCQTLGNTSETLYGQQILPEVWRVHAH